jgi:hypothetical protein
MPQLKKNRNVRKIVIIALLVTAIAGLSLFFAEELNRKWVFNPIGYIGSGSTLSVTIGQSRREAVNILKSNNALSLYESRPGYNCLTRGYDQQMDLDIFQDSSWRRGAVCLVSTGEIVSEVIWDYNFLAP